MEQTAEQRAWICGRDTGLKDGRAALEGRTIGLARAGTAAGVPRKVRAAFLNGYGQGISDAAGCVAGHHLASTGAGLELVPDR